MPPVENLINLEERRIIKWYLVFLFRTLVRFPGKEITDV